MKRIRSRKIMAVVVLIIAICLCLSVAIVYHLVHERQLSKLQNEALAKLERDIGEYDDPLTGNNTQYQTNNTNKKR